jgi:hypothetical protein
MRKHSTFNAVFWQGCGVQFANMLQLAAMMGTQRNKKMGMENNEIMRVLRLHYF